MILNDCEELWRMKMNVHVIENELLSVHIWHMWVAKVVLSEFEKMRNEIKVHVNIDSNERDY